MGDSTMHIMVGTDFSDSSAMAMAHAVKLAGRTGARLHIVHIAKPDGLTAPTNLGLNIPAEFPEAKEARIRLQRLVAELGGGLDTEIHVRIGHPVEAMLALIKEIRPDLVVVCSHGKGLLKRALLGSVSNQLAQRSPVPVMVVPTPGREAILNQPEPPPEPELPSVGRAVADTSPFGGGVGISSIGGSDIVLR